MYVIATAVWLTARHLSIRHGVAQALQRISSIFDSTPLQDTLRRHLESHWEAFLRYEGSIALAVTDVRTKRSHYFHRAGPRPRVALWETIENFEVLLQALTASASIPGLFPPVGQYVDGGVSRNQPLGAAVDLLGEEPKPIYVSMPNIETLPESLTLSTLPLRVLETWLGAGLEAEMISLGTKNTARAGLQKPLFPVCVIRPTIDLQRLRTGLLKFGTAVPELCAQGVRDAEHALKSFQKEDPSTWPEPTRPRQRR